MYPAPRHRVNHYPYAFHGAAKSWDRGHLARKKHWCFDTPDAGLIYQKVPAIPADVALVVSVYVGTLHPRGDVHKIRTPARIVAGCLGMTLVVDHINQAQARI